MTTNSRRRPRGLDGGFSLIELLLVLGVGATLLGMAAISVQGFVTMSKADSAAYRVATTLRYGRDAAIAQRRTVDVVFVPPNQIQLVRNEIPNGATVISTVVFENAARFALTAGLPDTPDRFGNASATDFDGVDVIRFAPDGTLTDGAGVPLNGTVFLTLPNQPLGARAVTITGATARSQAYRWTGTRWEAI